MKIQIVKGWTNGIEGYRVYVNGEKTLTFADEQRAKDYVERLKAMQLEKASIADDEHQSE